MWPKLRATPVVLVVDDEEPIRIAVRRMLEGDGYHVIEAENGAKAVTLLNDDRTVHVLVADLEMPEVAGEEMVRQLREKRPDLRVLYVTGHVDRLFSERPVLREGEAFVEKPFTSKAAARGNFVVAVRYIQTAEVIGRATPRGSSTVTMRLGCRPRVAQCRLSCSTGHD